VRLVSRIAVAVNRNTPSSIDIDDLKQDGMLGLMDAVRRFDARRGATLNTFARARVRGSMIDGMRSMDWVPKGVRAQVTEGDVTEADVGRHLSLEGHASDGAEDADRRRIEMLADTKARGAQTAIDDWERLCCYARGLAPDEKMAILGLYFAGLTMKRVGEYLGVTESRISCVHQDALAQMRRAAEIRGERE